MEPFSTAVAAALMGFPDGRTHSVPRQLVVGAAIAGGNGFCHTCDRSIHEIELTVGKRPGGNPVREWLVLWNLSVHCYDCM
jgi:hypothetical protein